MPGLRFNHANPTRNVGRVVMPTFPMGGEGTIKFTILSFSPTDGYTVRTPKGVESSISFPALRELLLNKQMRVVR